MADHIDYADGQNLVSNEIDAAWLNPVNDYVYRGINPEYTTSVNSGGEGVEYVVTLPESLAEEPVEGMRVTFKAHDSNEGDTTLRVIGTQSFGDAQLRYKGLALVANMILGNETYDVVWGNDAWNLLNPAAIDATYDGISITDSTFTGGTLSQLVKLDEEAARTLNINSPLQNGCIIVNVAAGAITVTLWAIGDNGSDPSVINPVTTVFSSAALTNGSSVGVLQTAAEVLVIPLGATGGAAINETVRWHFGVMLNDAGTGMELLAYTAVTDASLAIKGPSPANRVTTVAVDGSSDTCGVAYSNTARTARPWRYVGSAVVVCGAGTGQWDDVIEEVNWLTGMPLPGDYINGNCVLDGTQRQGINVITSSSGPFDSNDGVLFLEMDYTPTNALNLLEFDTLVNVTHSVADVLLGVGLIAGASPAEATGAGGGVPAGIFVQLSAMHRRKAGTTNNIAVDVLAGSPTAGTIYLNSTAAVSIRWGDTLSSFVRVKEYYA